MPLLTNAPNQYPKALQGTITFNAGGSGNYTVGETVTGSGSFSAKVVKWVSSTRKLTVKNISGTPTGVITGGSSSAAWTTATVTNTAVGGIAVATGGWNVRVTDHGVTRSKPAGSRTLVEVLFASTGLATRRTDFTTAPTFTLTGGAWSAGTVYDVSNGDYVTFTIISSEAVDIQGTVTYPFAITGIGAKTATYYSSSTDGLTHTFRYAVQAGDIGGTAFTISTGNFTKGADGFIADINGESLYQQAGTVSVGGTLATKSGVTIQA
jgi:hypothetical protein